MSLLATRATAETPPAGVSPGRASPDGAPPKVDRRIQRTQQLLGDALVALILEKGYAAVTIKDITERANVAYVTFFRHYRSKDELLLQHLQASIERLRAQIKATAHDWSLASLAAGPGVVPQEGLLVFADAQANRELYRILLTGQGTADIRRRMQAMIAEIFFADCEPLPDVAGALPREIVANHIAAALLGLIEWWLEHDMPYPPERMAEIYCRLIIAPAIAAMAGT